jgi:DNA or RNA helicases of superfamily II
VTAIKLRDYQREAIDAVFKAWADGMRRPAIVLPTGAGKTVVFSALVKEFMAVQTPVIPIGTTQVIPGAWDVGKRVIILAHRDELVDQAIAKLRSVMPDVNVGKVKAGDNDIDADVMVCSVQTLASSRRLKLLKERQGTVAPNGTRPGGRLGDVGLIITDECHHAAAVSYGKIYDAFPNALQLGVTATMARGDKRGLGKVWDDVVYQRSILNLISKGHLTDVRTKRIDLESLSLAGVKVGMGDWQAAALGDALMESKFDTVIANAYKEHAGDRQGIVFTPTVETAVAASKALLDAGIVAIPVDGNTPRDDRREIYERYRQGRCQVLVSCMVLTEGFDAPWAEVAVIARPTQSAPLYTQMVGRVLRPWPGKREALVLDLVGASSNKLRTLIDLEPGAVGSLQEGESLAEAVVREAEAQNKLVPAGSLAFELKVRDVDAFAASDKVWNRTPKGVLFIACGKTRVFLWPTLGQSGLWDVGTLTEGKRMERTQYLGLSIGEAMAWGEAVAEDYSEFSVQRSARWRKSEPTQAQLDYAYSLGIDVAGMDRGQVADAIDLVKFGQIVDHYV